MQALIVVQCPLSMLVTCVCDRCLVITKVQLLAATACGCQGCLKLWVPNKGRLSDSVSGMYACQIRQGNQKA